MGESLCKGSHISDNLCIFKENHFLPTVFFCKPWIVAIFSVPYPEMLPSGNYLNYYRLYRGWLLKGWSYSATGSEVRLVSRSQTLSSQDAYRLEMISGRLSSLIDKRPVTKGSGYARLRSDGFCKCTLLTFQLQN